MFVNGRFMRHPYFHKAVMTAYSGMLLHEHTPSYFLYFDIDPDAIDVNIHPTKTEIKFADEQAIFQILLAATKEALGKFNVTPSLDFLTESRLDIPTPNIDFKPIEAPRIQTDPNYNPFRTTNTRHSTIELERIYKTPLDENSCIDTSVFDTTFITESSPLFQLNNRYICAPTANGLMMIHQHRAHMAVLYEVLLEQISTQQSVSQQLLFPEILELSEKDFYTLEQLLPDLEHIGFRLEQFSPNAYSVYSVPALLEQNNASEAILKVIHLVQDNELSAQKQWQDMIALSIADHSAIPQGKCLTDPEMRDLVNRLMQADNTFRHLPNGQTIVTFLTNDEIHKRF